MRNHTLVGSIAAATAIISGCTGFSARIEPITMIEVKDSPTWMLIDPCYEPKACEAIAERTCGGRFAMRGKYATRIPNKLGPSIALDIDDPVLGPHYSYRILVECLNPGEPKWMKDRRQADSPHN